MKKNVFTLALTLGILSTSAASFAHNHAHGIPLTDVERKASEGVFEDKAVKDRPLANWNGIWQSINPYLINGDLDPVLEKKTKQKGGKTLEEYRTYYKKGYATDIDMIGIEDDVIEFHVGENVAACKYTYGGFKILNYVSGKKGVRYLFECQDVHSKAPKFVQFSDHIISPRKSEHYHIYMGNISQDALLKEMDNWPTFYPYMLTKAQVIDEMLHH